MVYYAVVPRPRRRRRKEQKLKRDGSAVSFFMPIYTKLAEATYDVMKHKRGIQMQRTFGILGGDGRFGVVAKLFAEAGNNVWVWGQSIRVDVGPAHRTEHLAEAVESADVVVLPIPALSAEGLLNLPFSEEKQDMVEVLKRMNTRQILAGGLLPSWLVDVAEKQGITVIDYGKREDFITANAVPTAEGAIGIALREMKQTLWDSNCLVLGYGRIGKVLSQRLHPLCRRVTVAARKPQDISMIAATGYQAVDYSSWTDALKTADVVFNTVPSMLLSADVLRLLPSDALIVDLASRPGGTDFKAAEKRGIKTVWALSLPGKTAPDSAGKIIADSICNGIQELE